MFPLENNHEISVLFEISVQWFASLKFSLVSFCAYYMEWLLHFFLKSFLSFYYLLKPTGHIIFQDEIFDMVKPEDPYKITLQDLVNRSGKN